MNEIKTVDHVIGLGANCEVAWNIRNYFKCEKAYPFDWWITPYNSLVKLLESHFDGLLDPSNLIISSDLRTVRCNRFNILHHHDFQRDHAGNINPGFHDQIPLLRGKYTFLIDRFYRECQTGRILFVRNRTGYDPFLMPDSDDIFEEKIVKLYGLLSRLFPKATIYLMITNVGRKGIAAGGNIIWDEIINYNDADDYRISIKGWMELFDRHKFRLV